MEKKTNEKFETHAITLRTDFKFSHERIKDNTYKLLEINLRTARTFQLGEKAPASENRKPIPVAKIKLLRRPWVSAAYPHGYAIKIAPVGTI